MGQLLATAIARVKKRPLKNTILVLPITSLSDYAHLGPWIDHVTRRTSDRLLIILSSPLFQPKAGINPIQSWIPMERLISFVYMRASSVAIAANRILMQIDVVLYSGKDTITSGLEKEKTFAWDRVFAPTIAEEYFPRWIPNIHRSLLRDSNGATAPNNTATSGWEGSQPRHAVVALGGTFDHLHVGHKILLSMAAWITERKIIVGITDDSLLTKKSNREVLESIDLRMGSVRRFLELFRPDIEYEVVPISDVYGPTGSDPDIQALVVSKETLSGSQSIAKLRHERGLPALETYVIEVISSDGTEGLVGEQDAEKLRTAKMSSSYIRQWIVEQSRK
ncbi:hypothetical protein FRC18_001065 [Serendipita sp. 400]|nr:hypothetical protein FRC18_001065 [Serendipita sp. 400]